MLTPEQREELRQTLLRRCKARRGHTNGTLLKQYLSYELEQRKNMGIEDPTLEAVVERID
ncbi:hypothetical protein MTAT_14140 [Moorella thermoacetica]|uniref:Uncharacterized protein n=1 Tax=Neomoorella thermoacetica TaxID=1525 RepID=A0AAC9HHP4_NEOTH|nr:hypothetical protein Maut_01381 [Moorella thermoacetica]TYL14014.1 hypothetical protein MTAT_14140 [Moorella thermoacetica]